MQVNNRSCDLSWKLETVSDVHVEPVCHASGSSTCNNPEIFFSFSLVCLLLKTLSLFLPPPALISYIRPVFVVRSDQDSRRKTVEEIKRRAKSAGEWPQVQSFWYFDSNRSDVN